MSKRGIAGVCALFTMVSLPCSGDTVFGSVSLRIDAVVGSCTGKFGSCDLQVFQDQTDSSNASIGGGVTASLPDKGTAIANGVSGVSVGATTIRLGSAFSGSVSGSFRAQAQINTNAEGSVLFDPDTPGGHYTATFLYDVVGGPFTGGADPLYARVIVDGATVLQTQVPSTVSDSGALSASGLASTSIAAVNGAFGNFVNSSGDRSGIVSSSLNVVIGAGATQSDPIMPTVLPGEESTFQFENAPSGAWFDPVPTSAYDFQMEDDSLFTHVVSLPEGFNSEFTITTDGRELGKFGPGEIVSFLALLGHGVGSFSVSGIDPTVDGEDPIAFPIQLAFDKDVARFSMTAAPVPVPAPFAMMFLGLLFVRFVSLTERRTAQVR